MASRSAALTQMGQGSPGDGNWLAVERHRFELPVDVVGPLPDEGLSTLPCRPQSLPEQRDRMARPTQGDRIAFGGLDLVV